MIQKAKPKIELLVKRISLNSPDLRFGSAMYFKISQTPKECKVSTMMVRYE